MFVLSSARLPRLSQLQPLARQRGTGTRFQPHSGLLRGEGRTSRFLRPRTFPLESLEWAGWCRSSMNSDRAQKAPDLPKSNLKALCILLGWWGSSEPPSRTFSLGTNATLRCALARGRTLSEARCRVSAGTQQPHGYQAAAGAVGQGAGPGFLGWARKGRGFPASDAGPGDRPRVNPSFPYLTSFHLFPLDSIGVLSSHLCKERPCGLTVMSSGGKTYLGQREFSYLRQRSCPWGGPDNPHFSGDLHLPRRIGG